MHDVERKNIFILREGTKACRSRLHIPHRLSHRAKLLFRSIRGNQDNICKETFESKCLTFKGIQYVDRILIPFISNNFFLYFPRLMVLWRRVKAVFVFNFSCWKKDALYCYKDSFLRELRRDAKAERIDNRYRYEFYFVPW